MCSRWRRASRPTITNNLHHFIATSAWDPAPLESVLAHEAERLVGWPEAVLIIDDTSLLKQGRHSVGVARQSSGQVGKTTNCEALVSLTRARGEVPVPVALRLYLPDVWTDTPCRRPHVQFAAVRVRVADGPPSTHARHLPGDLAWLVGEERAHGVRKYYLTNHPPRTPLRTLAAVIKARWACEQAHQQMKEELGLDHFEGRGWLGLHHHTLFSLLAFTFLQHLRLGPPRRKTNAARPTARTCPRTIDRRHCGEEVLTKRLKRSPRAGA